MASLGERRRDRDLRRGAPPTPRLTEAAPDAFGEFEGDDDSGWGDEAGGSVADQIISVLDARRTWMEGDTLRVDAWLDPLPADDAELNARARAMLAEPTLVGNVLARDGRASVLAARPDAPPRPHPRRHDLPRLLARGQRLRPLVAHIDAGIARYLAPLRGRITARSTGSVYTFYSVVTTLVADLARSLGVALVVITLLMGLFLRDMRLGLVAMVPNLLPIVFVIAFMGLTGVPIDLNSLLIASIAIGIVVDDTIHLLHHLEAHLDRGAGVEASLLAARRDAGRAVVATSLLLMLGFFIFAGAEIEPVRRFGVLIGLTVVMALLTDLITLPALLRLLYRKRSAPDSAEAMLS